VLIARYLGVLLGERHSVMWVLLYENFFVEFLLLPGHVPASPE